MEGDLWSGVLRVRVLKHIVDFLPLIVKFLSVRIVLLNSVLLLLVSLQFQRLLESKLVDFLEDSFESNQRLLEDFVPVILCEVNDNGNQQGESLLLISLKDSQEVVILKEAHGSVSNLKMSSADASNYPSEELGDERLDLVNFTNF